MPSFSATDRVAKNTMPVATSASHPSAAAAAGSNCPASSDTRREASAAADGHTIEPIGGPSGISGTPIPASSSANSLSGGAHIHTSAPSSRNCTASPTSGSTSPRDPYVDNNIHISQLSHFRRFWPQPAILRYDPGLAASPPVRYTLRVEESEPLFPCGAAPVPASTHPRAGGRGGASPTAVPG